MLMSAQGPPNADVIMAFDDVSVDLVNIDQVNGQLGPRPGGVHMSGPLKEKEKEKGKGSLGSWAQRGSWAGSAVQTWLGLADRLNRPARGDGGGGGPRSRKGGAWRGTALL